MAITRYGAGGLTHIKPELWLTNKAGEMLEDITPVALAGKVSVNIHNAIKSALTLSSHNTEAITPYSSIVAPFLTLTDQQGNSQRSQLGTFIVTPAKHSHRQQQTIGSFEGRGLEWILANDYFGATYNLNAGTNIIGEIKAQLDAIGLRHSIPASTKTQPASYTFPPDKSKLEIFNDMLTGVGYYTLWGDRVGIMRSLPYFTLAEATPALYLYSGDGGAVLDTVEQEGVYETLANYILVYKENTQGQPIIVRRYNTDPASPTSYVNLGRWVTRVIKDTNIVDLASARAIALRAVEESSTYTNKLKLTTLPLPERELHEVYDLAIYNASGESVAFGLWWRDSYELGFTPNSAKMTHWLKRLEPYGWVEEIA